MADSFHPTHVTRGGTPCTDLAALEPRNRAHRRLAGVSGRQEFHRCVFEGGGEQWVNAGNLRTLRRQEAAAGGPWDALRALAGRS